MVSKENIYIFLIKWIKKLFYALPQNFQVQHTLLEPKQQKRFKDKRNIINCYSKSTPIFCVMQVRPNKALRYR